MAFESTRVTLLERVRDAKDEASWREFYELYQPLLYRYARARRLDREVAEEIVQQCMTVLAQKMPEFRYAKERGGFKYWLRRLVNNKINDYFKKKKLPLAQSADFRRASLRDDSADELWEQQWRKRHLRYCLELIKRDVAPQTYQAFEYHVLADWPVERVTETLGLSADQVYAAKSRITKRLREKMKEVVGEDL